MKNIKNYNIDTLKEELKNIGEKPFRAEQIFKWLYEEKVKSFDDKFIFRFERKTKRKLHYM